MAESPPFDPSQIEALVTLALAEDIGAGDVTTTALVPPDTKAEARLVVKAPGVVAGLPAAEYVMRRVSEEIVFTPTVEEGEWVEPRTTIVEVAGPAAALLTAERLTLNFLQRLCGIATMTRACVEAVGPHPAQVMDTRKTTPGWRTLEKYAVRVGGGLNHRMGLFDMVLIKDNHIALAGGSVATAVRKAREHVGPEMVVEVEADTLDQVREALGAGADIIMLDNMTPATMTEAVRMVAEWPAAEAHGRALTEASGGITLGELAAVAATGVDRISLGMLTHSVKALDISMEIG